MAVKISGIEVIDDSRNITTNVGTVDGRDIAADGVKLDGIEAGADVTDATNVTAAGALMDSEVTNLAAVKAFDPTDYATAAQGALADSATQPGDNVSTLTNDAGYAASLSDLGVTATAAELNQLDGNAFTGNLTVDTINGIPLRPGVLDPENRIINGAFDFWQRGTSFSTYGYGADRWINWVEGGTVTMSRQSFTLGDTLGSNSPTYFLRQSVSGQSLASHYGIVSQYIEGVRSYAGQTITVLGWARRSSGSGNMVVEGYQLFGTGGSPSAPIDAISPTIVTLTGSWAPFAAVMTIPPITGKTLGTAGNDRLELNFWTSAGSNWNSRTNSLGLQTIGVDLWGIHIKVGTHTADATSLYRQPELGPELARCQRYYEVGVFKAWMFGLNSTPAGVTNAYKVTKRATPTTAIKAWAGSNISYMGTEAQGTDSIGVVWDMATTGHVYPMAAWTADAEL